LQLGILDGIILITVCFNVYNSAGLLSSRLLTARDVRDKSAFYIRQFAGVLVVSADIAAAGGNVRTHHQTERVVADDEKSEELPACFKKRRIHEQ